MATQVDALTDKHLLEAQKELVHNVLINFLIFVTNAWLLVLTTEQWHVGQHRKPLCSIVPPVLASNKYFMFSVLKSDICTAPRARYHGLIGRSIIW